MQPSTLGVIDTDRKADGTAPPAGKAEQQDIFPLSKVRPGDTDKRGRKILDVLWAVHDFKIYKTAYGISPHFSDDIALAEKQRKHYLDIGEQLAHMNHLIHLLGRIGRNHAKSGPWAPEVYYEREMARAIAQALTGEVENGRATLVALAARLEKRLINRGRVFYFGICFFSTFLIVAATYFAIVFADFFVSTFGIDSRQAVLAATMGGVGALLSTAAGLRNIEVDPSAAPLMSWVYGAQRMLVGVLGAIVLYLAVRAGVALGILFGDDNAINTGAALDPYKLAFISVLAGFSERLVPNLLNRQRIGADTDAVEQPAGVVEGTARSGEPKKPTS